MAVLHKTKSITAVSDAAMRGKNTKVAVNRYLQQMVKMRTCGDAGVQFSKG